MDSKTYEFTMPTPEESLKLQREAIEGYGGAEAANIGARYGYMSRQAKAARQRAATRVNEINALLGEG